MIRDIAFKINDLSQSYNIGQLQEIRKRLKAFGRRPGSSIFADATISDDGEWACHFGGRKELQFNIGIEKEGLRYGILWGSSIRTLGNCYCTNRMKTAGRADF